MMKTKKKTVRYIFLILITLNAALIFYLSAQNGVESSGTSGLLLENVFGGLLRKLNIDLSDNSVFLFADHIIRKLAHFSEYTLLGFNLSAFVQTFDKPKRFTALISSASGFLYACTDEIHQYFVPARSAQFSDVMIDTSGVIAGIAIFFLISFIISSIKKENKMKHTN